MAGHETCSSEIGLPLQTQAEEVRVLATKVTANVADQIKTLLSRSPDRTRLPGDRANSRWIAGLGKDPV